MRLNGAAFTPVQLGYRDSQRKGLFSADWLAMELRGLEVAFMDHDKSGLKISTNVVLRQLDPLALMR